jgi:HK97 gp10 family phage protein
MIERLMSWVSGKDDEASSRLETQAMAELAVEKAKQYSPVKTGQLRASIGFELTPDGESALIFATAPYAGFVHDGTKPHVIEARNAQALRFVGRSGQYVYRRRVNHPGTSPRPFLERALRETVAEESTRIGLRQNLKRILWGET